MQEKEDQIFPKVVLSVFQSTKISLLRIIKCMKLKLEIQKEYFYKTVVFINTFICKYMFVRYEREQQVCGLHIFRGNHIKLS
jgi:hypothetical protein